MELKKQVEDLQDKLALEFNKKRKAKQEHDEKAVELNEELVYYKEKYHDLKELLAKCTD